MTTDEKLAVISGNLGRCEKGSKRTDGFAYGNLYELVQIARESENGVLETARSVLPRENLRYLAEFCRIYCKYYGGGEYPFRKTDYAENSSVVAIPEIPKLRDAVDILCECGMNLRCEYGDSFSSCAEDVSYGNSGYVLMPYTDPAEGRLRTFDRLRSRYGLKTYAVLYVTEGDYEYGYQLCGLGFSEDLPIPPTRFSFSAETDYSPIEYLRGLSVFGAATLSAEFERESVRAVLDIENADAAAIEGMLMYMNAAADITVDGVYAEWHRKRK